MPNTNPSSQQLKVEENLKAAINRPLGQTALSVATSGPRAGLSRDPNTFLLAVDRIRPDEHQVRRINKTADSREVQELARSINEHGLLNAIDVRWLPDEDCYELVAGEGRFTAATQILKWDRIPVRVIEATDDEVLWLNLHENLHRRQLHPFDLAAALDRAMREQKLTAEQIARKLNKSVVLVRKAMTIAQDLEPAAADVLKASPQGDSLDIVYQVATLAPDQQVRLARQIVEHKFTYRQVVTVAAKAKQTTPATRPKNRRGGRPRGSKVRPYQQTFRATGGITVTVKARRAKLSEEQVAIALRAVADSLNPHVKAA